ncbi:MAG: Spi family protease inhibitor, partial [Prevotella sp.]|nr:Spi family protease inhibitor [Prevotella sp.]
MNKKTIITCMTLLLSVVATATPISQQQARQRAEAFMAGKGITIEENALVKSPRKIQGNQSYYVFNASSGQGYVIVSGDNCTESILGYSDKGTFDVNNVPEGLQWLLDMYDEQINRLNKLGITTNHSKAKAQQVHRPIAPLLKTLWNQGDPYNLLCPRYYRDDGSQGDLSATGCVATAIAQVMSFYRYPTETKRMIPGYSQVYKTLD